MPEAKLDALGWTYIGLTLAWTAALVGGMLFLQRHRHLPCIQIRRLPLLFAGVGSLHAYGCVALSVYTFFPIFPCNSEFWLMSIYLPFGIAMFHAANSQFLHIASRQKQFARMSTLSDRRPLDERQAERLAYSRFSRILRGVERADKIDRMMVWIGIGIVAQLVLTIFVFFASKKFHPNYGIFDYTISGTDNEVRAGCVKGWEWWLSIVWQFFWAWVYAPYMLWKSRGVRDVHGWRTQTICCCLAGLPASPLWLAGLYAPQMKVVNEYVLPPTWFAVSIFFMEVFTIGFPIVQVLKTQTLRQETLEALSTWEKRRKLGQDTASTMADFEFHSQKNSSLTGTTYTLNSPSIQDKLTLRPGTPELLNMTALEHTLRQNPQPLLQFAALKDFSGENVSFLTHVADWKRAWSVELHSEGEQRRQQFTDAVRIYVSFISLDFADFPINISSIEMKALQKVFSGAAAALMRRASISSDDTITPFDNTISEASSTVDFKTGINLDTLGRANLKAVSHMTIIGDDTLSNVSIPTNFGADIFEAAEKEIKYLVLTNTWPKFVNANYENNQTGRQVNKRSWWAKKVTCTV